MLVWKFLKVAASALLLGQDVTPQTFLQAVSLGEKIKYLIPGLSQS